MNSQNRSNTEYQIYSEIENGPNTKYIRVLEMDRIQIPNSTYVVHTRVS